MACRVCRLPAMFPAHALWQSAGPMHPEACGYSAEPATTPVELLGGSTIYGNITTANGRGSPEPPRLASPESMAFKERLRRAMGPALGKKRSVGLTRPAISCFLGGTGWVPPRRRGWLKTSG